MIPITTREVLDLILEFLLSVIIIVGGGYLITKAIAPEFATSIIALVVGFWFTSRSNASAVNTLLRQPPKIQIPEPPTNPEVINTPDIITPETPAPAPAPVAKTGQNI